MKVSLDEVQVEVIGPDGRKTDLRPDMADLGYAPKISIDEGMVRLGAWLRSDAFSPPRDL